MRIIPQNRRRWGGPVVGAAIGALVLAAAGCGSSDPATEGGDTPQITNLVIDIPLEPSTLDPLAQNTAENQRVTRLVYQSLLRWKEDGTLVPEIAAELPEISSDGLTYTFKIKEGLKFADGSVLDAEDVVTTFETIRKPEVGSGYASSFGFVDTIKAVDPLTVEVTLISPYSYFEHRMAMVPIISADTEFVLNDTYARTSNGSGPYQVEKVERGKSVTLTVNPQYAGERPPFETITFNVVADNAARIARLASHESHLAPDLPAELADVAKGRGVNVEVVETNVVRVFAYPSQQAGRPTANQDFRLAIAWAIDRGKIVSDAFSGAARPNSTYLTYGLQYHDEQLGLTFGDKPDLARANQYLEASGVPKGQKLTITVLNTPELVKTATIIQANLKELGVEAEVRAEEIAAIVPQLVSGDYDLVLISSGATLSVGFAPDAAYNGLYSKSAANFAKFADPQMDTLLETALTARTDAERAEAWRAVQQRDVETQGNIQIVAAQNVQAWSDQFTTFKPSSLAWFNTLLD
jgi:peptide/nickel transport system substrate-binding protein